MKMSNMTPWWLSATCAAASLLAAGTVLPAHGQTRSSSVTATTAQASSSGWVAAGSMNSDRTGHTATLLPDGKVLVVDGVSTAAAGTIPASAELFDPATATWTVTTAPNFPRINHTATPLADGKILFVNGDYMPVATDHGPTSAAELFDPATGQWRSTGNPIYLQSSSTATLLQNGKVLVAGGFLDDRVLDDPTDFAEMYDLAAGIWSPTAPLIHARYGHTATLLQDGRVLVVGGSDDHELASSLASAELYDPVTGTWSSTAPFPERVVGHSAILLRNGKVLVAGGYRGYLQRGLCP